MGIRALLDESYLFLGKPDLFEHLLGSPVHSLVAALDVHDTKFAKIGEEAFLVAAQQDKVKACHFLYHTVCSSSSSSA